MQERFKDIFYIGSLSLMKAYWRIMKPITHGARILLVSGNEVLLVRHRRRTAWNLPGGGISLSEDPASGALRELYEETRIKFNAVDYCLGTYCAKSEGKRDTVYVFVKTIPEKIMPVCSLEIQEAKWFSVDNLPEHISRATGYRIGEYKEGLQNIDGFWINEN
jgi:8-oxo-dGTP pyrophosphatase MutT (NUDIX family)